MAIHLLQEIGTRPLYVRSIVEDINSKLLTPILVFDHPVSLLAYAVGKESHRV